MRTSILSAAILGLFAVGCAGELSGTGEGDDVQGGPDCGNGTVDMGETCDDGNTASGDGCSSACATEQSATPKLNVTVDKPTVSTELNTDTMITVTLTGEGGFGETVNLTGSVVDGAGAPLTGWTVTFNNASVAVPANGTATAVATVHVPSVNSGLTGTVKIDAASTLGTTTADSAFTALNQISFDIRNNGAQCANDFNLTPVSVKVGTRVRFVNKFATAGSLVTVHVQGGDASGVPHEPDPGHAVNTAYERVITAVGNGSFSWYCHAPGPNPATDPSITIVP
jgi:cysteine-rich repeat protein